MPKMREIALLIALSLFSCGLVWGALTALERCFDPDSMICLAN